MNQPIDATFTPAEREHLLGDVRRLLPAFLSAAASEHADPLGDVSALLDLDPADLERVVCVHLLLAPPVRRLLGDLRNGLRRPATSSARPRETTRAMRGPVDWAATQARRASGGHDRAVYVVRPAQRVFETAENQALAWLLVELDEAARAAVRAQAPSGGWMREIDDAGAALRDARRVRWLAGVEPRRPDAAVLGRLATARSAFYRHVGDAARAVVRWREQPSPADLAELLCQRWFLPAYDSKLFEAVVALRLASAFAAVSPLPRRMRLLVGSAQPSAAFAHYALPDGDAVSLWYQHWPRDCGPSAHEDALRRHGARAVRTKPDLILQRTGARPDAVVLELKASRDRSYLADGLSQLLGYLHERPQLFARQPSGWLVAPTEGPLAAADASDDPLWALDADAVAASAIERFCPQPR